MYFLILFRYRAPGLTQVFVIWITVLLLVLWRITRRTLVSGISSTRLVVGVISAIVEHRCPPPTAARHHHHEAPPPGSGHPAAGSGQPAAGSGQPAAGSARFSLLPINVEVEEPETSENQTQSFVIHNIVWRRTAVGHDNMYYMICIR